MNLLSSFIARYRNKYIKTPIAGKVLAITPTEMTIENKTIRIYRPLVELGSTVKKGDIVAYTEYK